MLRQFLANFTWLDICSVAIVTRGCWVGFREGALVEVFKFIGLVVAVFIGLHFYVPCGQFLSDVLRVPEPAAHIFSYGLLVGLTTGIFRIIRDGMIIVLRDQDQEVSRLQRAVGLILGLCRGLILSSLVIAGCLIAGQFTLTRIVRRSLSAPALFPVASKIYSGLFHFVVKPIFPGEQENTRISTLAVMNQRVYE